MTTLEKIEKYTPTDDFYALDDKLFLHILRRSDKAFDRVSGYMADGVVRVGGRSDRSTRFIEPTLLEVTDPTAGVMQEEIFGPVLPMLTFEKSDEVVEFVTSRPKPLALYYFGPVHRAEAMLQRMPSGGACVNDTIMHIANESVPFGGVGESGMGHYHGRDSFDAFSHRRTVVTTPTWIDIPFRYMPYKMFRLVRKML